MPVWHEVHVSDFSQVPPGTIHAIGAGLQLLEIQQNVDVTFRLYDYGRPRDLHLAEAMQCAQFGRHPATYRKRAGEGARELPLNGGPSTVTLRNDQHLLEAQEHALAIQQSGFAEVNSVQLEDGSCHLVGPGDTIRSLIDARFVLAHDKQREQT